VQRWSRRISPKNKSKEESQFAESFWRSKMTFFAVFLQVMKHGSTSTTLKRSGKEYNGIQKFRQSKSRVKTMLLTFFDIRGIVHYEFVPTGQTVNQVYYLEVLERLRKKLDGNDPNILPTTHGSCIATMHLLTPHCL